MTSPDQEHADREEEKAFHPGYNRSAGPKHWKSQLLLVLALALTLAGGSLLLAGRLGWGLTLFVVGFPALLITGVWCFRNWDY